MKKRRSISTIFLLIFFLSTISNIHGSLLVPPDQNSVRFELIHRRTHFKTTHQEQQQQRITELFHRDAFRHRMISQKRGQTTTVPSIVRRKDWETTVEMPMRSGADVGAGEYFVQVKVGTPAQKFMLIADTGSELTWMNCKFRCGNDCETHKGRMVNRKKRVFLADHSSSFETIPCLSRMCKIDLINLFSLTACPTPLAPCAYDFSYMDGSSALGFFAKDTITVGLTSGRKMEVDDVIIGCTKSTKGQAFKGGDGVLGLGFSKHTFATKAALKFGGKFSYCLVDHLSPKNVSNFLTFGYDKKNENSLLGNMRHTKLVLGVISSFYGVNILGISIDSVLLSIPNKVWDTNAGGGTILDSGTSLTVLANPAYEQVLSAFGMSLSNYERLLSDIGPFEFCFNSTGFDEASVPRLVIHFEYGARFEPPVKSYVIDFAPQVKCLGFVSTTWPGTSVIGNILQQNHLWEFDLMRNILGFAPSRCT